MAIEIVTNYEFYEDSAENVSEDSLFGGDYSSVDVIIDGEVVKSYGDYYHDKGDIAAEAFVAGYISASGHKSVVRKNKVLRLKVF